MLSKINLTIITLLLLVSISFAQDAKKANNDIVDIAVGNSDFSTLVTALKAADLVDALKGEGPFTVFAPTNEAFAKLPKGALDNLLKDKEALKQVLLYHVVSGKVTSADVVKVDKANTLSGKDVKVTVSDSGVMINSSKVTAVDIMATNGVIHVIDTVLLPPADPSKEKMKKSY